MFGKTWILATDGASGVGPIWRHLRRNIAGGHVVQDLEHDGVLLPQLLPRDGRVDDVVLPVLEDVDVGGEGVPVVLGGLAFVVDAAGSVVFEPRT